MTSYRLSPPSTEAEWNTYHSIRREVLWEARGLGDLYQADHPDEHVPGNHPMLLFADERAVGVLRVDLKPVTKEAVFRRVAIRADEQRKGHGTALMCLAEDFAVENECTVFVANVASDAMAFYFKLGYRLDTESSENDPRNPRMIKERPGNG